MAVIPENSSINLATQIRDVLNNAGGSCTNDTITFFTQGNINKWAKKKPISYPKDFDLTDAERKSMNYGITNIPEFYRLDYMFNFVNGNRDAINLPVCGSQSEYFAYLKPTGGSGSPYRLGDFRGYDTAAQSPVGNPTQDTYSLGSGDTSINVVYTDTYQSNSLSLYDIMGNAAANYYVGVAIVNSTGSIVRFLTSSTKVAATNNNLSWTLGSLGLAYTGTYKMFLFLSSIPYTATQTSVTTDDASFILLDWTIRTIKIEQKTVNLTVSLTAYPVSDDPGFLHYSITLKNNESRTITVNDFTLYAYTNGTNYGSTTVNVNKQYAASYQETLTGTIPITPATQVSLINQIKYVVYTEGNIRIESFGQVAPELIP